MCSSALSIAKGALRAERRMPTQGANSFSRLFPHAEESQEMCMVSCPRERCGSLPFSSLPPELSRGETCFEVGAWWSCVFWTLLGSLCITRFLQVMGLDLEIHGVFSRCHWCWGLALSVSGIVSCSVSWLLERARMRSCLCSRVVPCHTKSSSKPVHRV